MLKSIRAGQLFLLTTSLGFSLTLMAAVAQEKLTERSKVTIDGIGSIRVGMTPKQATQASGVPIVAVDRIDRECSYYEPKGKLKGLGFMVINGVIARVEIASSKITTNSGAKIGDTEAKIKSLYPNQIQVTPHKYTNGHYLTFVLKDAKDKKYRLIFETDGKRVTLYRAGRLPEVEWVEGCA